MYKAQVIVSIDEYKNLLKSKDVALTAEKLYQMLNDLEDVFTSNDFSSGRGQKYVEIVVPRILERITNLQKLLHSADELL